MDVAEEVVRFALLVGAIYVAYKKIYPLAKFLRKQRWISENVGYPSLLWIWSITFLILVTLAIVL
ncbi:uncharacterized protein METZ01_LOCUS348102 [marine metagenome]|uniref:Uncharacterized protein n=1 Tax=marine metagenome TaxID=408172 RepID=A0A382RE48_9ZZZZ